MPDDGVIRVLAIIVGWTAVFMFVVFSSLSAYRRGRLNRWVLAGVLAVLLGLQPIVASFAAGAPVTASTDFCAVAVFVLTLVAVPWAINHLDASQ